MTRKKTLYEIELPGPKGGPPRIVEMLEMGTSEIFQADKTLPKNPGGLETKVEYLRYCLVKDGAEVLTYATLQGPKNWDDRFSLKDTTRLMVVWNQIHEPEEDGDDVGNIWRTKSGP